MNKKVLVIFAVVVGILFFGTIYLVAAGGDNQTDQTGQGGTTNGDEQQGSGGIQDPEATNPAQGEGAYIEYKDGSIENTAGTKLLFFHASWCPQCRALESDIEEKGVPSGVSILKVDYDTNQDLRQKYGITIQATVVKVDDNGNLLKKYVAYDSPTIDAVKQNLL